MYKSKHKNDIKKWNSDKYKNSYDFMYSKWSLKEHFFILIILSNYKLIINKIFFII